MSTAWPSSLSGFTVEAHEVVASTQDVARAHAIAGRVDLVVVAGAQTVGRGRLERAWVSPPGNLYASTVVAVTVAPRLLAACSLVVAVALAEAIEALGGRPRVKWPNDLLLDGRKVAGILLEHHDGKLIIGTGVNVAAAPPGQSGATTLAARGLQTTAPALLGLYLARLRPRLDAFGREGLGAVRDAWLTRAAGLGEALRVTLPDRILEGVHGGIDADGALVVLTERGPVSVAVGDVELVRTKE